MENKLFNQEKIFYFNFIIEKKVNFDDLIFYYLENNFEYYKNFIYNNKINMIINILKYENKNYELNNKYLFYTCIVNYNFYKKILNINKIYKIFFISINEEFYVISYNFFNYINNIFNEKIIPKFFIENTFCYDNFNFLYSHYNIFTKFILDKNTFIEIDNYIYFKGYRRLPKECFRRIYGITIKLLLLNKILDIFIKNNIDCILFINNFNIISNNVLNFEENFFKNILYQDIILNNNFKKYFFFDKKNICKIFDLINNLT